MKRLLTLLLCASPLLLLVSKWWSSTARGTTTTTGGGRDVNVLLWHWPFGVPLDLRGDVCLQRYNVPRCRLWHNRSAYSAADVVVFHGRDLALAQGQVPRHLPRPRGQRWVWMSLESPANSGNLHPFAGVFNLTMSYRRDADIIVPYGKVVPREAGHGGGEEEEEPLQRNKSIPVCWVWNNRTLSSRDLLPTISGCYFYLAFENSESRDYITEKLWRNAYQSGAVPVVLGPPLEDYQAVAPRGSFIHVDEFASVADLGRRLRQLVDEEAAGGYAAFFRWRRDWRVKQYTDWRERLCSICSQYSSLPENKTYADLHAWVHAPHGRMETTR
ncbi:hypothetical protein CRUP_024997 [Coryphaenoides rupestris]|nr:hypothetical protein CRUP_024997 [Coryphaenoides rupestris]